MLADYARRGTSAHRAAETLRWMKHRLGLEPGMAADGGTPNVANAWRNICAAMRAEPSTNLVDLVNWESDIWLCKSTSYAQGSLHSAWAPPEAIDDWVGVEGLEPDLRWRACKTAAVKLDKRLFNHKPLRDADVAHERALQAYLALAHAAGNPRDRSTIVLNQIIAWIDTAVGGCFKGVCLTSVSSAQTGDMPADLTLLMAVDQRLRTFAGMQGASPNENEYAQAQLIAMYNARANASGTFDVYPSRVGQSELWRERWGWLTQSVPMADARMATQIAAHILASPVLVDGLSSTLASPDPTERAIALCTLRRLLLTLRVLSWLEEAMSRKWQLVRAEDLNSFAYNALKPEWPRRVFGLSHRSRDVKPRLKSTRFWKSPFAAIDATYAPQWETNVGMIWGLFAATPVIIRMKTGAYLGSEWCRRESELLDYVRKRSDFVRGRLFVDASVKQTERLDELIPPLPTVAALFDTFPPLAELLEPPLVTDDERMVLAAAGAVRIIALQAGGRADVTNAVIAALSRDQSPDVPCPTNNPDGWQAYRALFIALSQRSQGEQPIIMTADYDKATLLRELEAAQKFPSLGDGATSIFDVLTAQEWLRVEYVALRKDGRGNQIVIDCRDRLREDWEKSVEFGLCRGLAVVATSVPVWFVQHADTRIDHWPLIGDKRPIFTEHFPDQFTWMMQVQPAPGWLERYMEDSGLRFADTLKSFVLTSPTR